MTYDLGRAPITIDTLNLSSMTIARTLPPNIDEIDKVFPGVKRDASRRGILFAYGTTIYNPRGLTVPIELIAHECTHANQQIGGVEKWWKDYLGDKDFRFAMELEAHRVEYRQFVFDHPARAFRRRYMKFCSERLSGPLYGNIVKKDEAKRLILEDATCA